MRRVRVGWLCGSLAGVAALTNDKRYAVARCGFAPSARDWAVGRFGIGSSAGRGIGGAEVSRRVRTDEAGGALVLRRVRARGGAEPGRPAHSRDFRSAQPPKRAHSTGFLSGTGPPPRTRRVSATPRTATVRTRYDSTAPSRPPSPKPQQLHSASTPAGSSRQLFAHGKQPKSRSSLSEKPPS